ncbi:uracil phosphoribosyltransferase [Algicola sagamiensis]|uniref:uracil phosphoribosyltransferase n=1 Tax=Algicola sagamiensis TaxID=163869 RepID=UPI00036C6ED3|nr:uracil phosphoribosyltransferase [Algicola sagamiensis]
MSLFILNQNRSVANEFLAELRDVNVQGDSMRFRRNLRMLGNLLAYEVSKSLNYETQQVATPLGTAAIDRIESQPILLTILRAGLPFYDGFLDIFDKAYSGFIGAYRRHDETAEDGFDIYLGYSAFPDISGRDIIVVDPMLATGKSLAKSLNKILEMGQPRSIKIVAVIAAPEGVSYLQENVQSDVEIYLAAMDEKLNEKAYIVPGLGDAGDLAYGEKL